MNELRWNPLLGTWTMVAANRQARPNLPKDNCPFCPKSPAESYQVKSYPNDFPSLTPFPAAPSVIDGPYRTAENYGHCEVLLYDSDHYKSLSQLPPTQVYALVQLWQARFAARAADKRIRYVFIFENRGAEVGVTIPHPHGQLYAYPFVPLKLETELDNCQKYFGIKEECLLCAMNKIEASSTRLIFENEYYYTYLPHFTDYPFGVFIVPKRHFADFRLMQEAEAKALADAIWKINGAFDALYDRPFPFMMCLHPAPVNAPEYADAETYFHFHIEFYPPLRGADKIKYNAASETGAWAAANTRSVEETAEELRQALARFLANKNV